MLHSRQIIIVAALLLAPASFAGQADEAMAKGKEVPVVAALCDALGSQVGVRPAYRRVKKAKDGTVTILGLTTEGQGDKADITPGLTLSVERIALTGITVEADGDFDVAEAKLTNVIVITDEESETPGALRLPEVTVSHLLLKPSGDAAPPPGAIIPLAPFAGTITAENGVVSAGGFSLQVGSIHASWQGDPDTGLGRTDFRLENIRYPASAIRRSDPSGVVLALIGGGDLIFDLWGMGVMTAEGGTFDSALSARSLGKLRLSGRFAGRATGLVASAPTYSQNDAMVPSPKLSPMTVSRLSVRFEDQSITGKMLAMLAAERSVGTEVIIEEAVSAVQQALADVQNARLVEQIKAALKSYLAAPKSVTLTAEPAPPAPVNSVIERAIADPASLLGQYPVSVSAND
jgi:hypothetical protein